MGGGGKLKQAGAELRCASHFLCNPALSRRWGETLSNLDILSIETEFRSKGVQKEAQHNCEESHPAVALRLAKKFLGRGFEQEFCAITA
jgi:hypothetical protein